MSERYWSADGGHERTALGEGYDAYREGFKRKDNPYPQRSDSAARWLRGYSIAEKRARNHGR